MTVSVAIVDDQAPVLDSIEATRLIAAGDALLSPSVTNGKRGFSWRRGQRARESQRCRPG